MKKIFFLSSLLLLSALCFAQRISKITLSSGTVEMFTIQTDDAVINISPDGSVVSYGVEYYSERVSNYSRLEPFQGRVDKFGDFDDASFGGKLKYLGRTPITYYASYDAEDLRGKIKTVGNVMIDYYRQYDNETMRGKIKKIGSSDINYFSSFDNEGLRGKLKTVGMTELNYYSSFEDKAIRGKIKTLGQINYTYYPSYDINYSGAMKTGQQFPLVAGIYYYIK